MNIHGLKEKYKKQRKLYLAAKNASRNDPLSEKIRFYENNMKQIRKKIKKLQSNKKRKK